MRISYRREKGFVVVELRNSERVQHVALRLMAPPDIQRATGTLRTPEAAVSWPAGVDLLNQRQCREFDQYAIILFGHNVTGMTAAAGEFSSAAAALGWWREPFNRFATDPAISFAVVPRED